MDFAYNHPQFFNAAFYDFEVNQLPKLEEKAKEIQEQQDKAKRKPNESISDARDRILAERERWKAEHGIGGG